MKKIHYWESKDLLWNPGPTHEVGGTPHLAIDCGVATGQANLRASVSKLAKVAIWAGLVGAWRLAVCCKIKGSEKHYILRTGPCTVCNIWRCGRLPSLQENRDFTNLILQFLGLELVLCEMGMQGCYLPKNNYLRGTKVSRFALAGKTLSWFFCLGKQRFFLSLWVALWPSEHVMRKYDQTVETYGGNLRWWKWLKLLQVYYNNIKPYMKDKEEGRMSCKTLEK